MKFAARWQFPDSYERLEQMERDAERDWATKCR
jgi:hypothetical protein